MPVDFIQQRKRQKYLLPIALVVIVITFIILWFGYFRKEKPVFAPEVSGPVLKEIKINFDILENPLFKKLQPFIKVPSFEGETGRDNPFVPY